MEPTGYTVLFCLVGSILKTVYCLIVAAILLNVFWVLILNIVISPLLQGLCNFE